MFRGRPCRPSALEAAVRGHRGWPEFPWECLRIDGQSQPRTPHPANLRLADADLGIGAGAVPKQSGGLEAVEHALSSDARLRSPEPRPNYGQKRRTCALEVARSPLLSP